MLGRKEGHLRREGREVMGLVRSGEVMRTGVMGGPACSGDAIVCACVLV